MKKGYFVIINLVGDTIQIYDISIIPQTHKRKEETKRNTKGGKARKDKLRSKPKVKRTVQRHRNKGLLDTTSKRLSGVENAVIRTPSQAKRLLRKRKDAIKHKTGSTRLYTVSSDTRKGRKVNGRNIPKVKRTR